MLSQNELKELLHYDPETGVFTWKARCESLIPIDRARNMWNTRFANKQAGSVSLKINGKKYLRIGLFGKDNYLHRIAWVYAYGREPNQIDHINGDGTDNRLTNLRDVDGFDNHHNQKRDSRNKTGVTGIFRKNHGVWFAYITVNGEHSHLGHHKDKFEAICARKSAENKYGFHENHGSNRPL